MTDTVAPIMGRLSALSRINPVMVRVCAMAAKMPKHSSKRVDSILLIIFLSPFFVHTCLFLQSECGLDTQNHIFIVITCGKVG